MRRDGKPGCPVWTGYCWRQRGAVRFGGLGVRNPPSEFGAEDRTRVGRGRYVIRCRDVLRRVRLPVRLETGVGRLDSMAADLLAGLGHGVTGLFLNLGVRAVMPDGGA